MLARPAADRHVRRFLHRAAVRADPEPHRDAAHRSRVIAGNNILNALFMVVSALLAIILLSRPGFTIPQLFLVTALLNAAVAIYIFTLVPEFLMRFLVWLLIHSMYRVEQSRPGADSRRRAGGAGVQSRELRRCAAHRRRACRRPIRFVMYYKIFNMPVLNFIFRTGGTIPDRAPRRKTRSCSKRPTTRSRSALKQRRPGRHFPGRPHHR